VSLERMMRVDGYVGARKRGLLPKRAGEGQSTVGLERDRYRQRQKSVVVNDGRSRYGSGGTGFGLAATTTAPVHGSLQVGRHNGDRNGSREEGYRG
jgi:hypothetical protein